MNDKENDNQNDLNAPEEPINHQVEDSTNLGPKPQLEQTEEVPFATQDVEEEAQKTQGDEPSPLLDDAYESSPIHPQKLTTSKPPSRFKRFMQKVLIGLGIAAIIFLGGYLTNYFTAYKPKADALAVSQAQIDSLNERIADLETENTTLTTAIQKSQDDIAALEGELASNEINRLFNQVLLDVNAARIALFMDDLEAAQAAMDDTQTHLDQLLPAIEKVDSDRALNLPIRLGLIVSGIPRDPETGKIDLEIFTKDLMDLKPLLGLD